MSSLGQNLRWLWLLPLLAFCLAIGARDTLAQQTPDLVLTKVWEGEEPDFWGANVSPDGRYVSEIDWVTGDLAVIDLETGKLERLTDKGSWLETIEWAETSVFSPDGRQIAYTWWNEKVPGYEIRAMNVDGSNLRTLLPSPGTEFYAWVEDWTDDGRVLSMLWQGDELFELGLVSEDGSVQVITSWKNKDDVFPNSAKVSPDGRFVAYDPAPQTNSQKRDIHVIPVKGGKPVAVVEGPGADLLMGWIPDGRGILFHSDRGLTEGIWMMPIAEGRPAGEPTLLKGGVHDVEPLGFARGAFLFGVTTKALQVHTAGIDLAANLMLTSPAPVEDPGLGRSMDQLWSADGSYLSYERQGRGQSASESKLVVRSTLEDEIRILDLPLERTGNHLGWSADGRFLVVTGWMPDADEPGVFRLDVERGTAEALVREDELPGRGPRSFALSADGKTLFYAGRAEKAEGEPETDPYRHGPFELFARNLEDGAESKIAEVAGLNLMRPSPDGSMLALGTLEFETRSDILLVVPATGGEVRELYRTTPPFSSTNSALAWTPDGKHLLFQTRDEDTNESTLWKIPAAGGEPVAVKGTPADMGFRNLQLDPAGTRIAFWGGESTGEIWKIENLPGTGRVTAERP